MGMPADSAGATGHAKSRRSLDIERSSNNSDVGHGMHHKTLTELEQFDEDGHIKRTGKDLKNFS
jgi:hypothetical protein